MTAVSLDVAPDDLSKTGNSVRIHRGILTIVVLTTLGLPGLGALGYFWVNWLPAPDTATRDQVFRWLVLRDVAAESPQVQRALVDRLQQELLAGLPAGDAAAALSAAQRDQLHRNIHALKRVWFETRVDQYAGLPPGEKRGFLKRQIAVVAAWSSLQFATAGAQTKDEAASPAAEFFNEIEEWIDEAHDERRARMIGGVRDGLVYWLATRDLAEQPMPVRQDLAERIARELDAGLEGGSVTGGLGVAQSERLSANGKLLVEAWLLDQAARYQSLDGPAQAEFLDARIDEFRRWKIASLLASAADGSADTGDKPAAGASLAGISSEVEVWVERAPPSRREALQKLSEDLRRRIAWRVLGGLIPGLSSPMVR